MLRGLALFTLGLILAQRLEVRMQRQKRVVIQDQHKAREDEVDSTLEDSFPASDPPSFSRPSHGFGLH